MIIRIVRMHFTPQGAGEFLSIFNAHRQEIRKVEGCTHLELLKDVNDPNTYTTLSHWEEPEYLEHYRNSALFASVWGRVKPLFASRTQAFSLTPFIKVD